MREIHPDVRVALAMMRELRHRVATVRERSEAIVARRPSPSGLVIPEVDVMGRLTDLYLAPGTCDRFDSDELVTDIMAAITESTEDAKRQYRIAMNDRANLPRPLEEAVREWRASSDRDALPNFEKPGE
ncbi:MULTISPECIES: hypothetical protein [Nocardia]|uniref:YbaB/EbfC family DNA-binding protein n=1 Tax=Nocardia elegans TaxID=300029 RepID=A0ABW6TA16_9NOCA|nr:MULTISPECIES: hypothetical protein [Nocardia]MBF6451382.1 hypothetical protein [Nocardia elegans]